MSKKIWMMLPFPTKTQVGLSALFQLSFFPDLFPQKKIDPVASISHLKMWCKKKQQIKTQNQKNKVYESVYFDRGNSIPIASLSVWEQESRFKKQASPWQRKWKCCIVPQQTKAYTYTFFFFLTKSSIRKPLTAIKTFVGGTSAFCISHQKQR